MSTRIINIIGLFLSVTVLLGCRTQYVPQTPPSVLPRATIIKQPIKTALVLGGGGARGMAHIGVIEELEKAGVHVDLVVGCSAGSIVGAVYADSQNVNKLKQVFSSASKSKLLDWHWLQGRHGFVKGGKLRNFLAKNLNARYFSDLKIPFRLVATDLVYGEQTTFGGGKLIPAIHASSAIPGIFMPVKHSGRTLVDGGVINPLPVDVAKKYSPKLIIAVDISQPLPDTLPRHLFGVLKRSEEIRYKIISENLAKQADIVIKPKLPKVSALDDSALEETYLAGKKAARKALKQICSKPNICTKKYR